jgi:hypothetical protein
MAKARKRTESASSVIDHPGQTPDSPDNVESSFAQQDDDGHADHRDRIAMRAYELFLARGGGDGGDFDDWLAAEREIAGGNGNASRGDAGE